MGKTTGQINLKTFRDAEQRQKGKIIGEVAAIDEDHHKLGALKIKIPGYNDEIDDELLPWVYPKNQYGTGGGGIHSFAVPTKETKVELTRIDAYNMTYGAEYITTEHDRMSTFQKNYPDVWGTIDRDEKGGSYSQIDMKEHEAMFHHMTGTEIQITGEGTANAHVVADLNATIDLAGTWKYGTSLDETIGTTKDTRVGTAETKTIGTNRNITVSANDRLTIGGLLTIVVGTNGSMVVGGTMSITATGAITLTSSGWITLAATAGINIAAAGPVNIASAISVTIASPVVSILG